MLTPERIDAIAKAALAILAIATLAIDRDPWAKRRPTILVVLALAAAATFPMRSMVERLSLVHRWEQFHYVLGAKYFPELGYDGLYEAAYVVVLRNDPHRAPRHIRDLRSGHVVASSEIRERAIASFDRIPPVRRSELERDVRFFLDGMTGGNVVSLFLDHGYNGPPTFTAVARLALRVGPVSEEGLLRFASLDLILVLVAFVALAATFGREGFALPLLVATTSLAWHFGWTGGGFLRFDWIAAAVLGIVALARSRLAFAGAFFAYATAVRVFPAAFAFAAALPFIAASARPEARRDLARFASGYLLALFGFAALGATSGHGLAAYREFAARLGTHRDTWLLNDVGFGVALVVDRIHLLRHLIDPRLATPSEPWAIAVGAARAARAPFVWLVTGAVAAYLARRSRARPPHEAAVFGVVLIFFATSPANYYWVICMLVPLAAPRAVVASLFATSLVIGALAVALPHAAATASLALSFSLLAVFSGWLYAIRDGGPNGPPAVRRGR